MAANQTNTTTYEAPLEICPAADGIDENADTDKKNSRLPKLFIAGVVLFTANLLVAAGVWFSPELRVNMYGEEIEYRGAFNRPSPFTEVISTKPAPKPRQAAKLKPVVFEATPVDDQSATWANASSQPAYQRGDAVTAKVEELSDYPRMTAAVHTGTTDVAPRAPSERAQMTN